MKNMSFYRIFDTAFRAVMLLLSLLLFAFIMAAGAQAALAANLREQAVLTTDVLKVSDIFDNAGRNADYVLGPAPQPGKDMVLSAPTLMRIAMALDLPWSPQSSADQIVVSRAATLIPAEKVKDSIVASLREKGVGDNFTIDTGASSLDVSIGHEYAPTVEVTNVSYNAGTSRFEATVSAPSAANPARQFTVGGYVRTLMQVPVLKTALRSGDVIGENDIDTVEIYASEIQPDMMLKAENLVGMTPRRMVMAGKPVKSIDIQAPVLVERGKNVTIMFNEGPLKLTAVGKALQNGAKGDLIRVVNNASNRPVDAIVNGMGEVIVRQ